MPDPIRILLIDDHALVREGIARLLGAQPDFKVVGEAATVDQGIEIVRNANVDVVLLDINLGTHQGGAFLEMARAVGFRGKVLVVTAGVRKLEAARLLQKGHSGIFLKNERPPLLIDRIRALVTEEENPLQGDSAGAEQPFAGDLEPLPRLTLRERRVLRGVFGGRTNKEIASDLGISEPLVKAFVQQLFRKTAARSRAQLVRIAMEKYWTDLETDSDDGAI